MHRGPFGKKGGPGKWNKTNLKQCHLYLIKLTDQQDTMTGCLGLVQGRDD